MTYASHATDPEAVIARAFALVQRDPERYPRESMAYRLTRFWMWLQYRQCYIRDVHEKVIPLVPNRAQQIIVASMLGQAIDLKPIRQIILKARKLGVSTIIQAFTYFQCRFYANQKAIMLAHQNDSTEDIFAMTHQMGLGDRMSNRPRSGKRILTFPMNSRYRCQTAGGSSVGAGGSPNILHRSELALWPKGQKEESDYTSGDSVATTPTSMIVDESTARGQDLFWGRFKAAENDTHPFVPVFLPWFIDSTLSAPVPDGGLQLDEDEIRTTRIAANYGLEVSMAAFAWRRLKVAEIGLDLFRQEYPSTPEEAIQSRKGLVLPGLREGLIDTLPFTYRELPFDERVGGWDYGYIDPTAMIAGVYKDQTLYVMRVFRAKGKLATDYAAEAMEGHTYYCDPANPGPRDELARAARLNGVLHARFTAAPRAKGTIDRTMTKHEWDMVRRMIADGRLKILRGHHEQLFTEADSFEWNPQTGEPDKTRTPQCGHFDTLDALRYMVMGCARTVVAIKKRTRTHSVRREFRYV